MDYFGKAWAFMATVPWDCIGEFMKSFVLPSAGVYIAWKFGRIQADIGRLQATTAQEAAKTARHQLRLQVMGERMKVYDAAKNLIGYVTTRAKVTPDAEMAYLAGIQGSRWLFNETVNTYLHKTLWHRMNAFHRTVSALEGERDRAVRDRLSERKSAHLNWFVEQYEELDRIMGPYLKVSDV